MNAITHAVIKERLTGIQLAVFEIIWPSFIWIKRLYMKSTANVCAVYAQTELEPSKEEWDDYCRLMDEVLSIVLKDAGIRYELLHGVSSPVVDTYDEIMSMDIFKKIAEEFAPWRLEAER